MFIRLIETSEEKKHLTSVLVSNGYPYSFMTNITKSKNRQASDKEPATEIKSTAVLPYIKGVSEPLPVFNLEFSESGSYVPHDILN